MEKKASQFKIRIAEEDLAAFKSAALGLGLEPTKAIRDLMVALSTAVETHGARAVVWPPELDHFPAGVRSAQQIRFEAGGSPALEAAEDTPDTYAAGPPEKVGGNNRGCGIPRPKSQKKT